MKRRFIQWGLCSGIIAVVSLLGLLLFDRVVISIFEPLLRPWFLLCRAVTPDAWEVRGNILLGMMWMISGIFVFCILFGAFATLLLAAFEGRRKRRAAKRTTPGSRSWVPFWLTAVGIAAVGLVFFLILISRPPVEKAPPAKGRPKLEDVGNYESGSGPRTPAPRLGSKAALEGESIPNALPLLSSEDHSQSAVIP